MLCYFAAARQIVHGRDRAPWALVPSSHANCSRCLPGVATRSFLGPVGMMDFSREPTTTRVPALKDWSRLFMQRSRLAIWALRRASASLARDFLISIECFSQALKLKKATPQNRPVQPFEDSLIHFVQAVCRCHLVVLGCATALLRMRDYHLTQCFRELKNLMGMVEFPFFRSKKCVVLRFCTAKFDQS